MPILDFDDLIPKQPQRPGLPAWRADRQQSALVKTEQDKGSLSFNDLIPEAPGEVPRNEPGEHVQDQALSFEDLIPGKQEPPREKPLSGAGGSFDLTPEEKYGAIRPITAKEEFLNRVGRWYNVLSNALFGDIPYLRELLPENIREAKPMTETEKKIVPLAHVGRDIALFEMGGSLVSKLSRLTKLGEVGEALTKVAPKTGRLVSKMVPEAAKGAFVGAATAESEEPKEIGKKAAKYGSLAGAAAPAVETASFAGKKIAGTLAKSNTLKGAAEWLGLRIKETPIKKLIRERYGDINSKLIDSEVFISNLEKQLTPEENRWLPYLIEKDVPKHVKESIPDERLPELRRVANKVRKYLDKAHADLMKQYGNDVGFIKDYVPHIWDVPKNKEKAVVNWFITRDPHLKRRLIATIREGEEKFGLTPKYQNITDLLRVYDQQRIKAAANVKFVKDLSKLKDETGVPLVMRADKAPGDWKIIDHPAVRRAFGRYVGEGENKKLMLSKMPVKVHPEVYDDVKAILENYQPGKVNRILDTLNLFAKQSVLTLSLFHHMALSETGAATGLGKKIFEVWNPVKIIKAFKNGTYREVLNNSAIAKEAVKDGLNIGAISDVEGGRTLVSVLKQAEKELHDNPIAMGAKAIRKPLEFNNKFLWDYLHTNYKLTAYTKLKREMMKRFPEIPVDVIGKEVAQFVNDTFGGQAWELLGKSPQWKLFSRYLLLSPDWTLSTLRQAMAPFGVGATSKVGKAVREELGKDFWRKALVYFGGGMNLLNYAYTKAYTGKGRFMWDNPPGKKTYLFIGYNPDGSERYLRWGKQFRELAEAINDPINVLGRKISPIARIAKAQVWSDKLWQKEIAENPFWSMAGLKARGKQLLKDITPYSVTQQAREGSFSPVAFALPVSRGMTPYRLKEGFKQAILRQDKNLAREYWEAGVNNRLDVAKQFKLAIAELKAEKTYEAKKKAREIVNRLLIVGKKKGAFEFEKLESSGEITPLVRKQIRKVIDERRRSAKQKREYLGWIEELNKAKEVANGG